MRRPPEKQSVSASYSHTALAIGALGITVVAPGKESPRFARMRVYTREPTVETVGSPVEIPVVFAAYFFSA